MIQITTDEEGDPVWRCFVNGRFVAEGDDSDKLLSFAGIRAARAACSLGRIFHVRLVFVGRCYHHLGI